MNDLLRFPKGFKWGTATAAHQIEGHNIHSDWWDWEKIPGKIKNNEPSGAACDHWNRMAEDVALMSELGVRAYRFTLEWAKIEPQPGEIDSSAVEHYRELLSLLDQAGIEPMITLHHFTSPRWLRERGAWEWEGAARAFGGYAKFCFSEIAQRCRDWTTVNEPMVHLGGGYVMGVTPPEKKGFEHLKTPLLGMLRAHAEAYSVLHETARSLGRSVRVGMAHHLRIFDPKRRWNPIDRLLATNLSQAFNWTIAEALETGRVRMKIPGLVSIDEKIEGLAQTQDYVGVNYYTRDFITLGRREGKLEPVPSTRPGAETNDLGWEIYPEGFVRVLREVARRIPSKPIFITENGIADRRDEKRPEFLVTHLHALHRAISEGIPVEGYFHWSLLDNFEWIEGFEPRFGLYEVDYSSLRRIRRRSAEIFAQITRENGVKL